MGWVRRCLLGLYKVLPRLILGVLHPFLRPATASEMAFLDRVKVPYAEAVYRLGEGHWGGKVKDFGLTDFDRVLDLGCGGGQWVAPLSCWNREVVGVDLERDLLEIARQNVGAGKARLVQGRAESLCFQDAVFDAVLCYSMIMYVDYEACLREVWRVLKPGGKLVVGMMGLGYYVKHIVDGVRCGRIEAVQYGIGPIATRVGQAVLGRHSQAVTLWTAARMSRVLTEQRYEVIRTWADPKDPGWPASYLGGYFYFCVEARKRPHRDFVWRGVDES